MLNMKVELNKILKLYICNQVLPSVFPNRCQCMIAFVFIPAILKSS